MSATLPRLLAGIEAAGPLDIDRHAALHGPLRARRPRPAQARPRR